MDDRTIVEQINHLADEEHQLYQRSRGGEGMSPEDHDRLRTIEVALDQCWDLLRQRRARRDAGLDPDAAAVRDAGTVEGYLQ
jgi:Protein of unknown function (DUF2630)